MSESLPIVIIVIAGILVVLALVALRIRGQQKEEGPRQPIIKKQEGILYTICNRNCHIIDGRILYV
jgi:hypothetical protein